MLAGSKSLRPKNAIFWPNSFLLPGKTKVKFRKKYVLIGSYIGCKLTPVELLCDVLYSRNPSECCTGLSLVPSAVATVGRVVYHHFFRQCDGYTTHFNPRPDGVWQVTGPDGGGGQRAPPPYLRNQ